MEGVLLKWTNYMSGWQPRFFVLNDDGTLAYYNSREDTRNGCRGSVNLALCEIVVHQNDTKRLDIVIPGEQHYSLKANTSMDRSAWLRVLGSSKLISKGRSNEVDIVDAVKARRSEVRLYMDLILQQASEAQAALARDDDKAAALNSLSMLVTTTQVLAKSVDDCLSLATAGNVPGPTEAHLVMSPSSTPTPAKFPDTLSVRESTGETTSNTSPVNYFNSTLGLALHRPKTPLTPNDSSCDKLSVDENLICTETPVLRDSNKLSTDSDSKSNEDSSEFKPVSETPVIPNNKAEKTVPKVEPSVENETTDTTEQVFVYRSGLSALEGHTFSDVEIIIPHGDMLVTSFLEAARSILIILDRLKTSVLSPVRSDVSGNITKIENALNKYDGTKLTAATCTIQALVKIEIEVGKSMTDPSASVGLVWLVRGLEFISLFLKYLAEPKSTDARQCASEAYSQTLRAYHGIMARTVFSLALQALPVKPTQFLFSIGGNDCCEIADIRRDIAYYVSGLRDVLEVLSKFLSKTGLSKKL